MITDDNDNFYTNDAGYNCMAILSIELQFFLVIRGLWEMLNSCVSVSSSMSI